MCLFVLAEVRIKVIVMEASEVVAVDLVDLAKAIEFSEADTAV